jgi:hypothetical protein
MIRLTYYYHGNSTQERHIVLGSEKEERRWRQSFKPFVKVVKREVGVCRTSNGDSSSAPKISVKIVEEL